MIDFKSELTVPAVIMLAVLLVSGIFITAHVEAAGDKKDVSYKLDFSFDNNLMLFKGKHVRITLSSGEKMSGVVKNVKNGMLHLEKITGREFFDALIRVEDISAMDARFR